MSNFSVVQNFICDIDERLHIIENNTPNVAKIWGDYDYFVNFNSKTNAEKIFSIYRKYFPKLYFQYNLQRDWAMITLSLVNQVKSPYVILLNEDMQFRMDKDEWENIVSECFVDNDIDYLLLNKIGKYNKPPYTEGKFPNLNNQASEYTKILWGEYPAPAYGEGNHVYFYPGKYARHKRLAMDAVYKTDWLVERLVEFIVHGEKATHDIPHRHKHIPHFYEGYYDLTNGIIPRFPELKCAIPKKDIIEHFEDVKQNQYHALYKK